MIDLKGKVALVTGGGAGIGRGIAEAFARLGAVIVVAETHPERAKSVAAALAAAGGESLVEETDVRDRIAVDRLAERIRERFGGLDILVNNVGDFLGMAKPFDRTTDEEWQQLYDINLRHLFVVTRAMLPLLEARAPGGSIINVSSIEGFRGIPMCVVYGTFKAAVTGFTQSLAVELGPKGIRVNTIAPETTETEQVQPSRLIAPEHRAHVDRWLPLGRFGTPEDAAGCAVFLATDLSSWVTGTTIHLDGGALAAAGWTRDPKGLWTNVPVITGNGFNF